MKLRDILKLGLYLSISGTLVIGSPVHAATVKRKAKPASARKATPPKLSDTEVLSRQLVASRFVDDADLSLFTRAWRQYSLFADFNEDQRIDDQDLSLLVSHWGWVAPSL